MNHHNCRIIRSNSKKLFLYLEDIFKKIENITSLEFWIGVISGFIDADGHICKGDIVVTNKNIDFLISIENKIKELNIHTKLWMEKSRYKEKTHTIWRLRIGTRFKYEKHYSRKIQRIYGGDFFPSYPS